MPSLTFITPVAPYHLDLIERVKATVAQQTIPCHHIIVLDTKGRGAGWARNYGLQYVTTDFVSFLDCDDELDPRFAERMLAAFDGRRYVYSDHIQDDRRIDAPCRAWVDRTWHPITTLIPTAWAKQVGGFREDLPGGEDSHFFVKLLSSGYCGKRLAEPLFHYKAGGQRARNWLAMPDFEVMRDAIYQEFGGKHMGCGGGCGDNVPVELPPSGDKEVNDELSQAIWGGNRAQRGPATGRLYPRSGNGKLMWVAPEDIDRAPHLWRRVEPAPAPAATNGNGHGEAQVIVLDPDAPPVATDVPTLGRRFFDALAQQFPATPVNAPVRKPMAVDPVPVTPDARKAVALYRQALDAQTNPPAVSEAWEGVIQTQTNSNAVQVKVEEASRPEPVATKPAAPRKKPAAKRRTGKGKTAARTARR